LTYSY